MPSPTCHLCNTPQAKPANQEIVDTFKADKVCLCLECFAFYKDKRYWLGPGQPGYGGKEVCIECGEHRPLFKEYCAPCWRVYKKREAAQDAVASPPSEASAESYHADDDGEDDGGGVPDKTMWVCGTCTLRNPYGQAECDACGSEAPATVTFVQKKKKKKQPSPKVAPKTPPQKPRSPKKAQTKVQAPKSPQAQPRLPVAADSHVDPHGAWTCVQCTLENEGGVDCLACQTPRPPPQPAHARAPLRSPRSRANPPPAHAPQTLSAVASWTCKHCTLSNTEGNVCQACDKMHVVSDSDCEQYSSEEDVTDGWACPHCTYINHPDLLMCGVCDYNPVEADGDGPVEEEAVDAWHCEHCTFANPDDTNVCEMCGKTAGPASPPSSPSPRADGWTCAQCTTVNNGSAAMCETCERPRPKKERSAKVLVLRKDPADKYDTVLRPRVATHRKKAVRPPPQPQVPAASGGYGGSYKGVRQTPAKSSHAPKYALGDRKIMMIDQLRKSDKVNNHALRLVFDRFNAINVCVIIKDGKKTGKGAVEFDADEDLRAALTKTKGMTICESRIKTRRCAGPEDFSLLPESWQKGKPQSVAKPEGLPTGARPTNRVAVVRENRCKNDKCARECYKVCPVGAVNDYGTCKIDESKCTGCNLCMKKRNKSLKSKTGCPFDAIVIVNIPKEQTDAIVNRYGKNGFTLCQLPRLKPSRLLGVIGENGSGKSTMLKILCGRIIPNAGLPVQPKGKQWPADLKQRYKGTELQGLIQKIESGANRTSMKLQHVDKLRAEKGTVREFLAAHSSDAKRVKDIHERLTLCHLLDRAVSVLSGGELQRTAVAASTVKDADIYLYDEPSSYLDVKMRLQVGEVIRSQLDGKNYVVCVEHDLAVCDYLADSVALLHGQASAYGVVSKTMNARDGINAFLHGYIEQENVKFRSNPLVFKMHEAQEYVAREAAWAYPQMSTKRGTFSLTVQSSQLNAKEVTALLGENGCGKTTLLEIMCGKLTADVDGSFHEGAYLKTQELKMPEDKTVEEYVKSELGSRLNDKVLLEEVMGPLNIADLGVLSVSKLSGGEMQRVALCVALSQETDLILIDEPSAFLDAEQRMTAAKAIRRVAQRLGKTIVVVEHDLMMTSFMADRVVVFEGEPGVSCVATRAEPVSSGLNRFLRQLDVTVRLDAVSHRPRFNKKGSVLDRDQRSRGIVHTHASQHLKKIFHTHTYT